MFNFEFLKKNPKLTGCDDVQLTLLPPRLRPKPLEDIFRDDEELDTKIKVEKKKTLDSPETLIFSRYHPAPHVWMEVTVNGETVKIQDVGPPDFDRTDFMKILTLMKALRIIEDPDSIKQLSSFLRVMLEATTSFAAFDSKGNVVGAALGLLRDFDSCEEASVTKARRSKRMQTHWHVLSFVESNVGLMKKYNENLYYMIIAFAAVPGWQDQGIEKALISSILKFCQLTNVPRVAAYCTTYREQYYLAQFNAKTEYVIYYSEWKNSRGMRIFRGTGRNEPKLSLVSIAVPEAFKPQPIPQETQTLRSSRAEKHIKDRMEVWNRLDLNRECCCDFSNEQEVDDGIKSQVKFQKLTSPPTMTSHLFPESSTYNHSYVPHEILQAPQKFKSPEASLLQHLPVDPIEKVKKIEAPVEEPQVEKSKTSVPRRFSTSSVGKYRATGTSLGVTDLEELPPADKAFFLSQTYRLSSNDYQYNGTKTNDDHYKSLATFTRKDDNMVYSLSCTKPDLYNYGFGLPNKCCSAWGRAQSRTLPTPRDDAINKSRNKKPSIHDKHFELFLKENPAVLGKKIMGYTGHKPIVTHFPKVGSFSNAVEKDSDKNHGQTLEVAPAE